MGEKIMKKTDEEKSELQVGIISGLAGSGNSIRLKFIAEIYKNRNFVNILIDSEGIFQHLNKDNKNNNLFNHVLPFTEDKDDINVLLSNLRKVVNEVENPDTICIYVYGVLSDTNLVEIVDGSSDLAKEKNINLFYTLQSIAYRK